MSQPPKTRSVRDRLERARQADYLSIADSALLLSVSHETIRRALPRLELTPYDVLRHGRILRIRRLALLRLFSRFVP